MNRMLWKEEYSVGDDKMDRQHQQLFSLIDRLEDSDMDASAMSVTFEKLDIYVREHLSDEEEMLRVLGYDDLDAHMRQHDEFRDWLETAKQSFSTNDEGVVSVGRNLHVFLRDWLLSHILNTDQDYKRWIEENKS